MSEIGEIVSNYNTIRQRLYRPSNAVRDTPIDLKRRLKSNSIPPDSSPPFTIMVVLECLNVIAEPPKPRRPLTTFWLFQRILEAVADHYKVSLEDIRGRCRTNRICQPRHVVVYLAVKHAKMSMPAIGRKLNRDHTTALSANRRINRLLLVDETLREEIARIERRIFDHA